MTKHKRPFVLCAMMLAPVATIVCLVATACASVENLQEQGNRKQSKVLATTYDGINVAIAGNNCISANDKRSKELCGTTVVKLELHSGINFEEWHYLGYGEAEYAVKAVVEANNKRLSKLFSSNPDRFEYSLTDAVVTARDEMITLCDQFPTRSAQMSKDIIIELFKSYAWMTFRKSLIRSNYRSIEEVGRLPRNRCFSEVFSRFLSEKPGALNTKMSSVYDTPGYFARAMHAWYKVNSYDVAARIMQYRADLDTYGINNARCPIENDRKPKSTDLSVVWKSCLEGM